jgi:gliding motility-associated-like protein
MLDEQYKELLNTYGEQPPQGAWNAIEKALHQPWYAKPWGKAAIFTSVVSASLGIVYFATAFNRTPAPSDRTQTPDSISTIDQPGKTLPEANGTMIEKEKATDQANTTKENENKPYVVNPLTGSQLQERNITKAEKQETINNPGSPAATEKIRSTNNTTASSSTNPLVNTSSLSLKLSDHIICVGKIVTIKVKGAGANMILDFGDNHQVNLSTGNSIFPYTYMFAGAYNVSLKLNNAIFASEVLNVEDKPQAYFKTSISENTTVQFNNLSEGATKFFWFFDDGKQETTTENKAVSHYYTSTSRKLFNVKLIAINTNTGCCDTFESAVKNHNFRNYFFTAIPNVFTPNNDGLNDLFEIPASEMKEWHIIIVDEAGHTLFETDKQQNSWNGKLNNMGNDCVAGNYHYIIKYMQPDDDEMHQKSGPITLIR